MSAVRSIHSGLVHLFAGLLVVQFFLAGLGAFTTVHDERFSDSNFNAHAALGTGLTLVALVVLLLAAAGRWSPRVTKLSAALFVLMVIQNLLAGFGADNAPAVGGLHAVNAVLITGVAYLLVRAARRSATPAVAV